MGQKLKDAAEMEAALVQDVFEEPQAYLKAVVGVLMDETHGRDTLVRVVRELNRKTPFMVLNDLRVAHATNSLRRVEVLRQLV